MNPPLPSTPPTIMGSIGAAGKEIADVGQNVARNLAAPVVKASTGFQNVGRQIRANMTQGTKDFNSGAKPYYATDNILKGTGKAFRAAFKK